ncbi:hypothetical protein CBL_05134 [Carabus blaptoides fortunei]
MLPPNNLMHPVLPRRMHGKLMCALCRKCCDELCQTDCSHSNEQRQFIGTWIIDQVRRAVTNKSGGLFSEYIDTFLKMNKRQQALMTYEVWPVIMTVISILRRTPPVFKLHDLNEEDIDGVFSTPELQKVLVNPDTTYKINKIIDTRGNGRRKQVHVRWRGYSKKK